MLDDLAIKGMAAHVQVGALMFMFFLPFWPKVLM